MTSDPTTNSHDDVVEALQLAAGALQAIARRLPDGEREIVIFTGQFAKLGAPSIAIILDRANRALAPYSALPATEN